MAVAGDEPQGMLARVADVRTRRRLAAEFMHRDAGTQLEVDWTDRLEEALRGKNFLRTARRIARPAPGQDDDPAVNRGNGREA